MSTELAVIPDQAIIQLPASTPVIEDGSSLVAKTVFLKVAFGRVGTSRRVPGTEVLVTDADKALLSVTKTLLDSPELEAIKSADTLMRKYLFNTCLPFEMGILLLPYGLVDEVQKRLLDYEKQRDEMVDAFIKVYPSLCEAAVANLGSLYDQHDYPSVSEIKDKFKFEWRYMSFSVPSHLKEISADLFETEKEKFAEQMQIAVESITTLMREDLLDLVTHLEHRLTPTDEGKPRQLRESSIAHIQEFLKSFDMRNVTNDAELGALVTQARDLIGGASVHGLRNSDELREKIRAGMANIKASLGEMVQLKPGRKFQHDDE